MQQCEESIVPTLTKIFFLKTEKCQVYNIYCTHERSEVVGQPSSLKSIRQVPTERERK